MKNIPRKIYLQHGIKDDLTGYDFSELVQVTHSVDRVNENDIEYVHADEIIKALIFARNRSKMNMVDIILEWDLNLNK